MPNYTEMALELQVELEQITRAQEKLQKRLEGVINAINAIEVLVQESDEPIVKPPPLSEDEEQGFTEQVRAILRANSTRAFSAVEIRNVMLEGNPGSDPKVALIHTHNTLKRLFRQNEVLEVQTPDNRTGYKWKSGLAPIVDLMAALKKSLAQMEGKQSANPAFYTETPTPESVRAQRRKTMGERMAERRRERLLLQNAARRDSSEQKGE
jgi:hypothetical protein